MQYDKIVVGLDIGTTKIVSIVGKMNQYGKLEILGLGESPSNGVVRGMVHNIDKTVNSILKAVQQASETSNVDIKSVNVGVAGQHILSSQRFGGTKRTNAESSIELAEVERLTREMYLDVTEPGTEIMHVMPQYYNIDGNDGITDPVGYEGARIEGAFHVITAHTSALKKVYKSVEKSELVVKDLILEPLASSLSVLSDEEKEAGIVLVDIGGGTTDIAIFKDNIIQHSAVLPFGGEIITYDIKEAFNLLHSDAEQLKVRFGSAIADDVKNNVVITVKGIKGRPPIEISQKELANVIEARIDEIIEYVYGEIQRSGFANGLGGGIVITGGGSQLASLKQRFEYKTGLFCRIGQPHEHLGKGKFEEIKSPKYATGVGLVLSGFLEDAGLHKNTSSNTEQEDKAPKETKIFKNLNLFGWSDKLKDVLTKDLDEQDNY